MQIHIKAINAKLTPEAHEFINEKIGSLLKYYPDIIDAHVEIGLTSFHHQKGDIYQADVNLQVPKKILRASVDSDDIEKSINKARSILKRELVKYKQIHS